VFKDYDQFCLMVGRRAMVNYHCCHSYWGLGSIDTMKLQIAVESASILIFDVGAKSIMIDVRGVGV